MISLTQVIAALRREIDAALEENAATGGPIRLEAERVVLSLEISISEQRASDGGVKAAFNVLDAAATAEEGQTHRLTFEFKSVPRSPAQSAIKPASGLRQLETAPKKLPLLYAVDAEEAIKLLSSVFGPPGFDSSARATVFREVFAELSEPQAATFIASLSSGSVLDDVMLTTARHRINGVFRSGPLRSIERGSKIFADLFSLYSIEPVVRLVEETWKTQQAWMGQ